MPGTDSFKFEKGEEEVSTVLSNTRLCLINTTDILLYPMVEDGLSLFQILMPKYQFNIYIFINKYEIIKMTEIKRHFVIYILL